MKKLRKLVYVLLFFILWIMLTSINVQSEANSDDLYLNGLNFDAKINENGEMYVTETWDIDIHNTNTLFKTFKTDKSKYSGIKDVKVANVTNGVAPLTEIDQYMYHVTNNCYYGMLNDDGNFEIAWGVGLDNKSDNRIYQISYIVEDAISKYSDYAELYWQFVGEDFEIDAKKIKGTITLQSFAEVKENIKVWGHTEDLNGEIYVTDLNKIEFTVNNFNAGRYVEVRSLFPTEMISYSQRGGNKEILNDVIEEETKWANDANTRRTINKAVPIIIVTIFSVILIVLTIKMIKSLITRIKKTKTLKKIEPTENIIYFREIPREDATPAEALYILKNIKTNLLSTDIGKIFSATLLDFNLKGILDFKVEKMTFGRENITITLLDKGKISNLNSLDETVIANFLLEAIEKKGENNQITLKKLESYVRNNTSKIIMLEKKLDKAVKKELENKEIRNEKEAKEYEKVSQSSSLYILGIVFGLMFIAPVVISISVFSLIAIIPFIILCIANIVSISMELNRINVYTGKGIDEAEKWKGLKKYMEEFSLMQEKEVPEIILWEKFLVYATAFGIADKVLKQLKIVYPDLENMINNGNYTFMYLMVHTNFSQSFSSSLASSMSSTYSSATGGGGGFSGGGGGGRRPEAVEEEDRLKKAYFF